MSYVKKWECLRRCIVAVFLLCFCTQPSMAQDGDVNAGQQIAQTLCAKCHAVGTSGSSPLNGAPLFRTLSKKWPIENLEEAFAEGITVGHSAMPEFHFKPEDIGALLAYIKSIQE